MADPRTTSAAVPSTTKPEPGVYAAELRRLSVGEVWRHSSNPLEGVLAVVLLKLVRMPMPADATRQWYPSSIVRVSDDDLVPEARAFFAERDAEWSAAGYAPMGAFAMHVPVDGQTARGHVWLAPDGRALGQSMWARATAPVHKLDTSSFVLSVDGSMRRLVTTAKGKTFDDVPAVVGQHLPGASVAALVAAHEAKFGAHAAKAWTSDDVLPQLRADADYFLEVMIARGVYARVDDADMTRHDDEDDGGDVDPRDGAHTRRVDDPRPRGEDEREGAA